MTTKKKTIEISEQIYSKAKEFFDKNKEAMKAKLPLMGDGNFEEFIEHCINETINSLGLILKSKSLFENLPNPEVLKDLFKNFEGFDLDEATKELFGKNKQENKTETKEKAIDQSKIKN